MTHAQDSIKGKIIDYLKEQQEFTFAGIVEDKIRQTEGSKASCVARRLRELYREGLLERRLVQVVIEKKHNKLVVQY
jgi:hypothetical protein